ncbi:hypothetical protein G9A89_016889 [Geosiphon pyriformis]|nr:hypothetical protein G9A89_016889 [Geosiphon pyriformis]
MNSNKGRGDFLSRPISKLINQRSEISQRSEIYITRDEFADSGLLETSDYVNEATTTTTTTSTSTTTTTTSTTSTSTSTSTTTTKTITTTT